ncbi:MAG: outer membrane protein assembly factor BamA [Nitrospirota bacterium]|nr:outer membrane protein assembly factor BamA [Nitrospirota bacterium]
MIDSAREGSARKTGYKAAATRFFLPIIIFFLLMPLWSFSEAVIAGNIEVSGLSSIGKDEFISLLGVKPGAPVDEEVVRAGVKRAFLKGIFEDISVDVSEEAPHEIVVHVRERDFLKNVYVEGNYPIPKKEVLELFLLKKDQVMRYDLVHEAKENLKEKLSFYGFPDAKLDVKTDRDEEPYRVNLYLAIDAGPPLIIKTVRITGTDLYLKDVIKTSEGDVYDQNVLNNDLERIKKYLKDKGYYKPSVGPFYYREGELEIAVTTGEKLLITLNGNTAISEKNLMKEVPFFKIETFNDVVLSEAVDRMLNLYYEEGYASAQIAPVISSEDDVIHITFFIFEGDQYRVENMQFIGTELSHEKLQMVMNLRKDGLYNPGFLEIDRDSLKEIYGALGYLETEVSEFEKKIDEEENTVDITIRIHEGERTEINTIDITGVDAETKSNLLNTIRLKKGDPYNEVDISDSRFRIIDYFSNLGYATVDVLVKVSIEMHKANVAFSVIEGEKKFFGKTIITGNRQTRYEVINREVTHRENEPYSFKTLANERQKLYKLGLFTDVEIEPIDRGEDKKDILISVREGNAGAVEFGFGYADYEQFRGFFELSYRNLWGWNRKVVLRTELSSLEKRLLLQYHEPWFLDRPLPLRAFFLYEDREELSIPERETRYRSEKYSVSAGVEKKLSDSVKADLYYEFSLVRTTDVQPDVVLSREDVGTLAISSVKPSIAYDTRDNPFNPSEGILAGLVLKIASPLFLSESHFAKFTLSGSTYNRIHRRVVLAVSAKMGLAFGFGGTDELPLVERFFLGGRSTVRGYEQDTLGPKGGDGNPTGGNAFLMGNVELRTFIGKGFSLVPFFDFGYVWIKVKDMDPADFRYTTGIGLRYNTPVGPLRVDYGVKLNREHGESKGEIHFSIGHAF